MIRQLTLVLIVLAIATSAMAQKQQVSWLRDAEFQKALNAPLDIQSTDESLRSFFVRLGQNQRVAVFLDRRVDPSSNHDFSIRSRSLRSAIVSAAATQAAGMALLADAVYVGPGDVVAVLPDALTQLRSRIKELPAETKKIWQRSASLHIPRLSRPAELFRTMATENEIQVEGLELIPHDIWPQIDLPAMTLGERFACLLVGFGYWPEISPDGRRVQIVKLAIPDRIARTYSRKGLDELCLWLSETIPDAQIDRKRNNVNVTAAPIDHYRIMLWLAENEELSGSPTEAGIKVVSLNATASIGAISQQVAQQLGIELVCDPAALPLLEQRVTVQVDRVSYPELLSQVLADTGLSFRLDQRQLRLFVK